MPKFSILTPVHLWSEDRVKKFEVCINSVKNQTFKDFEWVVINDGSITPFDWLAIVDKDAIPHTTLIEQPHLERINAYNAGFKEAKGEWICFLDSDDEYKPQYLDRVNYFINRYPEMKMFNFGCVYHHKDDKFTFRDPFIAKRKGKGHVRFGGGNIVNGTFVFHRSIYEELGAFPPGKVENIDCKSLNYWDEHKESFIRDLSMVSPYDFSAYVQLLEFPELQEQYFVKRDHTPDKAVMELGNPWGNDFYLWYKYTRKHHSKAFREYLYIIHPR